jgi:dsRNA-specific ribonuclease
MDQQEIYYGVRDQQFKEFIFGLLKKGKVKTKYIDSLLTEDKLQMYSQAFTAASAHSEENYEIFEQLGDLSANKFIVWYMYQRFPFLKTPKGVKVVARLRINYGAKQSFAEIAEKLGFWPFITCAIDGTTNGQKYRNRHKKDLLEDVFEAFIGCTEFILDNELRTGVGYGIIYDILSNIFDEIPISLAYEDLFDPKTRLKEIFDCFPDLGTWGFTNTREEIDEENHSISNCSLYLVPKGGNKQPIKQKTGPSPNEFIELPQRNWILMSTASASTKTQSQQKAAALGITVLAQKGYSKAIPDEYKLFEKFVK